MPSSRLSSPPLDPPEPTSRGDEASLSRAAAATAAGGQRPEGGPGQQHTDAQAIEAALIGALKVTETGEDAEMLAVAEVERRSGASRAQLARLRCRPCSLSLEPDLVCCLHIAAVSSPPRTAQQPPGRAVRPALQSVQSSYLTNCSSTRSPASRTTSQTSIISTVRSL